MMAMMAVTSTLERSSCVCGFHIYCSVWDATIGEELLCECEPSNAQDRYTVAVIKDEIVIGNLLCEISCICSLFLQRGSSITCRITCTMRYSADLTQGGLKYLVFCCLKPRLKK